MSEVLQVRIADATDEANWSLFLRDNPAPHFAFDWRIRNTIYKSFSHRPVYLIAESSEVGGARKVVGVLPLFEVKSFLFGRALISVPYFNGGGVHAISVVAASELLRKASELKQTLTCSYLELRHREPGDELINKIGGESLTTRTHKAAMRLKLEETVETQFKTFDKKLRAQIRRPEKAGFSVAEEVTVSEFYQVFSKNMRDLGTPVFPKSLFNLSVESFGADAQIVGVRKDNRLVAAGILLSYNGVTEIPWASSLREFNRDAPNMLLYWAAIQYACKRGDRVFDFGRSTVDSGTYRFKAQWGAEPLLLHWQYLALAKDVPDINPKNGRFSFLSNVWSRLPLGIANVVGPWVTRGLP